MPSVERTFKDRLYEEQGQPLEQTDRRTIVESLICEVFSVPGCPPFERVLEGTSTEVYRIWHRDSQFYLRILPQPGVTFGPEVLVHQLLRARNIHVPEVIYFVPCYPALELSVMVTTAIPGKAIGYHTNLRDVQQVLVAAGRELAVINSLPVQGFGWLRRNRDLANVLRAAFPTQRDFLHHYVDEYMRVVSSTTIFPPHEVKAIENILINSAARFDIDHAHLAHGDFDVTHIYHEQGVYRGIIDFSAIRGTNPYYDLGYFKLGKSAGLPQLLEGYRMVTPLAGDYEECISFSTMLLALRRLGQSIRECGIVGARQSDVAAIRQHIKLFMF